MCIRDSTLAADHIVVPGDPSSAAFLLIAGASGGVGTFAVQIARALGGEVTAVVSPRNVAQAQALGAARVIDYTAQDFAADGPVYDLVVAVNGRRPINDYRRVLRPGGVYVMVGGEMGQIFLSLIHICGAGWWCWPCSARWIRRATATT